MSRHSDITIKDFKEIITQAAAQEIIIAEEKEILDQEDNSK